MTETQGIGLLFIWLGGFIGAGVIASWYDNLSWIGVYCFISFIVVGRYLLLL